MDAEVAKHQWADTVIMQFPVYWMGAPWSFKKNMDEVYAAGMDGRLCNGDDRTADAPKANYGMSGSLTGTHYMLSCTLNARAEAFDGTDEPFFAGTGIDDQLAPVQLSAKFFAMTPLPTFAAHDVIKNAEVERDLVQFDAHLAANLETTPS